MQTKKRKPSSQKPTAAGSSDCPVAALIRPAALLLQARAEHVVRDDGFAAEQISDVFDNVASLAATRQATSLTGAAFQLLMGLNRLDSVLCGNELKIRERAHRDVMRVLLSAYTAVVSAAGTAPDEIILDRFLGGPSSWMPECIEAAFAAAPGDPVEAECR